MSNLETISETMMSDLYNTYLTGGGIENMWPWIIAVIVIVVLICCCCSSSIAGFMYYKNYSVQASTSTA